MYTRRIKTDWISLQKRNRKKLKKFPILNLLETKEKGNINKNINTKNNFCLKNNEIKNDEFLESSFNCKESDKIIDDFSSLDLNTQNKKYTF